MFTLFIGYNYNVETETELTSNITTSLSQDQFLVKNKITSLNSTVNDNIDSYILGVYKMNNALGVASYQKSVPCSENGVISEEFKCSDSEEEIQISNNNDYDYSFLVGSCEVV